MEHTSAEDRPPEAIAAALERLADLAAAPVHEHPALYADIHERLSAALADADPKSVAD